MMRCKTEILAGKWAVMALVCGATALAGCFGWFRIPPVDISFTIAKDMTTNPGEGLLEGAPLVDFPVLGPIDCNLPSRNTMEREVRAQAGSFGGFVKLDKVLLQGITLEASAGSFDSFTEIKVWYVTVGGQGIANTFLGSATAPGGFGDTIDVIPAGGIDLLDLMEGQACGAARVTVSGTAPGGPITFDAVIHLRVHAEIGL